MTIEEQRAKKPRQYHFWNCYKCGRFVKILWENVGNNSEVGYFYDIAYECSKCGKGSDGI